MENLQNIIDEYINSIIRISFDNLPIDKEWSKYKINVCTLKKFTEMDAEYILESGEEISFNPKYQSNNDISTNLTFIFLNLRDTMYKLNPDNGAWFSCIIEVDNKGKFSTKFNYDDIPNFTYWPSKEKFIDDLKQYPRKQESIPDWLNLALNGKQVKK